MEKDKKSPEKKRSLSFSQSEEKLYKINRALKAITGCNQALLRAKDEISLLKEVCRIVVEVGGYKFAWIGFAEPDENKTVRPITFLGYEEEYLKTANITWADTPQGRGPTGIAIRTGKTSICRNTSTDPNYAPWRSEARKRGYASSIALPLIGEDRTFGSLNIYATKPDAFDEEEIKLLEGLSGDLSYGLMTLCDRAERKRTEQSLRESEERFKDLFENSPIGIYRTTPDGRILMANPTLLQMLGYSSFQELASRNLEEEGYAPDYPRNRFKAEMESNGEIKGLESAWMRKDGKVLFIRENAKAIRDDDGVILYYEGTVEDITERKKMEEVLRSSEERYRLLFERNLAGVLRTTYEGKILDCNESFAQMLGYESREEVLSKDARDLHPSDKDRLEILELIGKRKLLTNHEIRMKRKDGSLLWGIANVSILPEKHEGSLIIEGILINITERKQAEEALRKERDRTQKYLDVAGVMMIAIDPNHKVILINKKGCEVLGYDEDEILGKEWFDSFVPETKRAQIKEVFDKLMSGRIRPAEYFENPILTKKGEERVIAWHNTVLTDESGNIMGTLSSGEDVTEKRKLEASLIQAEKLAAVGTLSYGIAHEFNNILAGMMVNAELGLSLNNPKQMQECFLAIAENCQRGSSITHSLLAIAGEKRGRKELIDITHPLENILAFIRRELEKRNVKIVENFKPIPEIFCDPGQFSEVFLNMINNARDAMYPKGGTLTIEVEPLKDNIWITFKDTGCGIPDEIKTKIFEPFVTTKGALGKSEIPGTGLGLFLVYGIIDSYQGKIEVESKVGKGATFAILIPVSKNLPPKSFLEREIKPAKDIQRKLSILLIDDEEPICSILKRFLESKGHQVTASLKAKEGWEHFRKEKFDVVLSDITMPEMDGIDLIKKMKKQDQKTKIIVLTGHVQKRKEDEAKDAGADEVLIKPFRNELLYQTIARVVSE